MMINLPSNNFGFKETTKKVAKFEFENTNFSQQSKNLFLQKVLRLARSIQGIEWNVVQNS